MHFHAWWLFAVTAFFVSATPGPNMLHIMARSVELGLARSTAAMAGCFAAVVSLLAASALGLTAVLLAVPGAFTAMRWAGAAYLLYLGLRAWTAPVTASCDPAVVGSSARKPSSWRVFRIAFMVGMSNPKALLFAAALLPQFIDPALPRGPQFMTMIVTFGVIETAWYFVYALGGRSLATYLTRPAAQRAFNRLTGGLFMAFGAALLGSRAV